MIGGHGIGGKNVIFTKTYTGLPKHSRITLKMTIMAIDSWDNELAKVDADGKNIYT